MFWRQRRSLVSGILGVTSTIGFIWGLAESIWASFNDKPMIPTIYNFISNLPFVPQLPHIAVISLWALSTAIAFYLWYRVWDNTRAQPLSESHSSTTIAPSETSAGIEAPTPENALSNGRSLSKGQLLPSVRSYIFRNRDKAGFQSDAHSSEIAVLELGVDLFVTLPLQFGRMELDISGTILHPYWMPNLSRITQSQGTSVRFDIPAHIATGQANAVLRVFADGEWWLSETFVIDFARTTTLDNTIFTQ